MIKEYGTARTRAIVVLFVSWALSACQSSPLSSFEARDDLSFQVIQGAFFKHLVILNKARNNKQNDETLTIYLEGDGKPWHTRHEIAWDPTPEVAHMLALMAQDDSPAIYLGRPCYFNISDPACDAIWWTHKRYSPEVVESLNSVLDKFAGGPTRFRLIGHSGGGALAMLMASMRDDVEAVVTLAANTDIAAWTRLHDYSPLAGSLNPADMPLDDSIRQFHYVGRLDEVTPPAFVKEGLRAQPSSSLYQGALQVIEGIDHNCCWEEFWPDIKQEVEAALQNDRP